MKLSSLPFSIQSLFHGTSVIISLALILGAWVALWQINYNELYYGNNQCFAGNTIATYGGDSALYCPNTNIVKNLNITALFNADLVTYVYLQSPDTISMAEETKTWDSYETIYIDDDDEEIAWWFNMNPGSYVNMTFDISADEIYFQVDDDDIKELPLGTSSYLFKTETIKDGLYSSGYKLSFTTKNSTFYSETAGTVHFEYTQTQFSKTQAILNDTCFNFDLVFNRGCLWEFDYDTDFCIIVFNNLDFRNWGSDYSPYCINVLQAGRDPAYAAFLVPVTSLLVFLIIVVNIAVAWIISKRNAHIHQSQSDVTLSSVEKFYN